MMTATSAIEGANNATLISIMAGTVTNLPK